MSAQSYSELLKDPRWQRRRLEILNRANFQCEECEADDKTLHVHHKLYRKGAKPWEYADEELTALCENCHAIDHERRARLAEVMALMGSGELEMLLGYAQGMMALTGDIGPVQLRNAEHVIGISNATAPGNGEAIYELCDEDGKISNQTLNEILSARRKPHQASR